MRSILKSAALAAAALLSAPASAGLSGDLKIFLDTSNPAPRATMEAMIARFQALHPDLRIETTIIDREAYKTQIRNFLTADAPDVATWYAANRMRPYVSAGLFEDVSDLWQEPEIRAEPRLDQGGDDHRREAVGRPVLLLSVGASTTARTSSGSSASKSPRRGEEEKANCAKIVASGRACYTIGTKFLWTAGGWFDYLNLRTNGYDFHMSLTQGEVPWTDDRVARGLRQVARAHRHGGLHRQPPDLQLAGGAALHRQRRSHRLPHGQLLGRADARGRPHRRQARLLPVRGDHPGHRQGGRPRRPIPSTFRRTRTNKEAAREFLRYVVSAENQTIINNGQNLGQLPVNAQSAIDDDEFLRQGFEMLSRNSPGGASPSSSTATLRPKWPRSQWRGSRSSWSSPTTSTTSWSASNPHARTSTDRVGAPDPQGMYRTPRSACGHPARSEGHLAASPARLQE